MAEIPLMRRVILLGSKIGSIIFRNNVGMGWVGKLYKPTKSEMVEVGLGDVVLYGARPLHAGLCEGSSDCIGGTPIRITQEMVGRTMFVFTAVEVKDGTDLSDVQRNFLAMVSENGGIAVELRELDDLKKSIDWFINMPYM